MAVQGSGYPLQPLVPAKLQPPQPKGALGGKHTLLEKGTFEQLQRNEIIETRPHILHFGGFQIHKEHTHVLKILNISATSMRVSIIGPTTQWFKISYDKKGLLAPGMSEEITVTFMPHEWRYYYDTVKIHCGELAESLVVPIHAYPSANDIVLPRILDFGRVPISTSRTKVIPLSCKIPIQFEYEITVLEAHPEFDITPLTGVIPADGTVEVLVTFHPTKHRTSRCELQFNVAQFGFDPVAISLVGSSAPDLTKDQLLKSAAAEQEALASRKSHEDTHSAISTLKEKQKRTAVKAKPVTPPAPVPDRMMDGFKVPVNLIGANSTNFVLNQTGGKLPLKDLSAFIQSQKEAAENRRRRAEAKKERRANQSVESLTTESEDEAEDADDKAALELQFEMLYREVAKSDKDKELKNWPAIGEEPPAAETATRAEEGRAKRHTRLREAKLQSDIQRVESVLSQAAVAVPENYQPMRSPAFDENVNDTFSVRLQVIDKLQRAQAKALMRVRAQLRIGRLMAAIRAAGVTDRASCRAWVEAETKAAATGTARASEPKVAKSPRVQTKANAATLKPTASAASKTELLDTRGKAAGATGKKAAGETATTAILDSMEQEVVRIPPNFILPLQIPTTKSGTSTEERREVDVIPLGDFEELVPAPISLRMDYKVLQYEPLKVPPAAAYIRPQKSHRLEAALEEHLVRGPRGDIDDGAEEPLAMPDSCLLPFDQDALGLLIPSTECRTYIAFPDSTECDPEYRLSQQVPFIQPLQTEPLLPPYVMCTELPVLASWRQPRQLHDPFEHFDPMPCSFAEAGGKMGPRLGCDVGGERLSFLPVGGYARDIPSDTDSDGREDFELPPPGEELYEQAMQSLAERSKDVGAEVWRCEQSREEHLQARCARDSTAVRERLRELNKDVDYEHKLYLG